jgi:hypothetical protein
MKDILSLDILQFFEKVTGLKPTEAQKELLISLIDPNISKIAISAGRQTGKSLTCSVAAVYLSLHGKEGIILCSAQDNWIYNHVRDIFNGTPELKQYIVSEGVYSLVPLKGYETTSGSKVHVRGSTDKSLRGIPASIVFCDEAALLTDETISTALGNLSGKYKFILLSTAPRERKGTFYQIICNPQEYGFRLFRWSAENCTWHPKDLLESKKKMLGQWYKPEVLGEVLEDQERGIVDAKDVDACTKDVLFSEGGTIECGIDWASGDRAKTVLTLIERISSARVKVLLSKSWDAEGMRNIFWEISNILKQFRPSFIKVDASPPQYIDDLKGFYSGKIYAVNFGEFEKGCTLKDRMLGQLIHKVQTHQLEIQTSQVDLIKQLKKYKRGKRYGDDFVDSLCLAIFYDPERFKPETGGCASGPWDTPQRKSVPYKQNIHRNQSAEEIRRNQTERYRRQVRENQSREKTRGERIIEDMKFQGCD